METQTEPIQQENQTNQEESLEEIAKKRDFVIKQKKIFFRKIRAIFILLFIVGTGMAVTYVIAYRQRATAPAQPIIEEVTEPTPEDPQKTWELHRNDLLKIFVNVPPDSKVVESDEPAKVQIIYTKASSDPNTVSENNLENGFIFRVTPLPLGTRDLLKAAQIKMDGYRIVCPDSVVFSSISDTKIDGIDAKSFTVNNCGVDYKVSYVPKFGIYYEVAQIYRGDIGVRQMYFAQTEVLLNTLRFFPDNDTKPYDPYLTYFNEEFNFSFRYPDSMDTTCCDMPSSARVNPTKYRNQITEKLLVAADRENFINNDTFSGFGVFIDKFDRNSTLDFNTFVAEQKQSLFEDYQIVKGTSPTVSETTVSIGGVTGVILKGYNWRGADMIYAEIPISGRVRNKIFLTISTRNLNGESYNEKLMKMLESFEYHPNL